ncbi:MAG: hypothetical protein GWO00_15460, partial [Gemmatimonadetes bacterium]|nr:hypothetical protein [Gemmatimonadota bacterium]NIU32227.1 hypothetical protein [Gemmatimonadota bacterium]NIW65326.1 hypothetical protein [Gemmatimonadota bacterium]NIX40655.1 hypothetical protein [Gemmatimonadota bacterium]
MLDILTLEDEKGPAPSSWEEAPRRIPVPAAHLREIVQTAEQISEIVPFGDLEESPSELFSRANPRGDPAV